MVRKKMIKKGSFTVEAAGVMSVVLLVLLAALYLCFYVHNRAWLTAAAYESALTGSMEAMKPQGEVYETAKIKSRELGNTGFFGAENLTVQVNSGNRVSVIYDLDTIQEFGGFRWHLQVEGSSAVLDPVKRIRQIKAAAEIIKSIGE